MVKVFRLKFAFLMLTWRCLHDFFERLQNLTAKNFVFVWFSSKKEKTKKFNPIFEFTPFTADLLNNSRKLSHKLEIVRRNDFCCFSSCHKMCKHSLKFIHSRKLSVSLTKPELTQTIQISHKSHTTRHKAENVFSEFSSLSPTAYHQFHQVRSRGSIFIREIHAESHKTRAKRQILRLPRAKQS